MPPGPEMVHAGWEYARIRDPLSTQPAPKKEWEGGWFACILEASEEKRRSIAEREVSG